MVIKHFISSGITETETRWLFLLLITEARQLGTSADINIFNNSKAGVISGLYSSIATSIQTINGGMRHDLNHRISPTELLWCGCDATDDITGMRGKC